MPRPGTLYRPIYHVPDARSFDDLFLSQEFGRDPPKNGRKIGFLYCLVTDNRTSRGEDHPHVWSMDVLPSSITSAIVEAMVGLIGDAGVYIELCIREDGSCLAIAKYDRIIGSRWLAEIDPATIPRPPAKQTDDMTPAPAVDRMERLSELLGLMVVEGDLARFSGGTIEDWDLLKGAMLGLGGKWVGGKTQGFRFGKRVDVAAVIEQAWTTGKITNEAREADFIASPRAVAERVVALANISPGDRVLEPSAGHGAIADAVLAAEPKVELVLCELLEDNRDALIAKGYEKALADERDFMKADLGKFDVVVMNPPFKEEIAHVTRAHGMLRAGGRLVTVMSGGIVFRQDAKTERFRQWVAAQGGTIEELPSNSFRESGTGVSAVIVRVHRGTVDERVIEDDRVVRIAAAQHARARKPAGTGSGGG